jgi:CRP-like cAMP-binding protein
MYFKQKDIFWGMSKEFAKEIMKISVIESHQVGELLFREGDPANSFYVLLKGAVKLSLGENGQVVHVVSKAGEAFGWSSLIGRKNYSASAEFMAATKLLKFNREKLQNVMEKDTANSLTLFKRLAEILGNRLLQSYRIISSTSRAEMSPSYGTGQILTLTATELEK